MNQIAPEMSHRHETQELAERVIASIAWHETAANVWQLFADAELFADVIAAMTGPYQDQSISHVVGIESRGFLLGAAAAHALGSGFIAVRKGEGFFPGDLLMEETGRDYKGEVNTLRMQDGVLGPGDRVLVIDDWFETGSQFRAVKTLIERAGAEVIGSAVIIDQTPPELSDLLGIYTWLVRCRDFRLHPA